MAVLAGAAGRYSHRLPVGVLAALDPLVNPHHPTPGRATKSVRVRGFGGSSFHKPIDINGKGIGDDSREIYTPVSTDVTPLVAEWCDEERTMR